jgi:8-oxo-dGTP diphosphatase
VTDARSRFPPATARRPVTAPKRARLWIRVGVKGLLLRRGRLLLLRRHPRDAIYPGRWDLSGGGVEVGHTLEESLRREIREETGLRVRVGRPFDVRLVRIPVRGDRTFPSLLVTFRVPSVGRGAVRLDPSEHIEARWVGPGELGPLRIVPTQRAVVAAALGRARRIPTGSRRGATRGP